MKLMGLIIVALIVLAAAAIWAGSSLARLISVRRQIRSERSRRLYQQWAKGEASDFHLN